MQQEQIESILTEANKQYRAGNPVMSDTEYDNLLDQLPINHLLRNTVEPEKVTKGKYTHTVPMLSTDKAKTDADIFAWFNKVTFSADALGMDINEVLIKMTAKLDGLAGILYEAGPLVTRGKDGVGNIVTDCFAKGVLNTSGRTGKGELVMKQAYFDNNLSNIFEFPRNVVVGIVMGNDVNAHSQIALDNDAVHFATYDTLFSIKSSLSLFALKFRPFEKQVTETCAYPTDGVVLEVMDENLKHLMGSTDHHHNWQIALKPKDVVAETTVIDLIWQTGRTGKITPVMVVEPTKLPGITATKATAHNSSTVYSKGLGKGAIIEIKRAGLVIPSLHKVIKPVTQGTNLLRECPSCGSNDLIKSESGKDTFCSNPYCGAQQERRLLHFFKTIGNIDGFGPATIAKILDQNETYDLLDIYDFSVSDFEDFGFGPKQSINLQRELAVSLRLSLEDWKFLAAMGIPLLGKKASKILLQHFYLNELYSIEEEDIVELKGFDYKTAKSIVSGFSEVEDYFDVLLPAFSDIQNTRDKIDSNTLSAISGKRICFSGSMESSRETMQEEAELMGAVIQSSVNSKTDILVTGENVGKSKLSKAAQHHTTVITEQEYKHLIQ